MGEVKYSINGKYFKDYGIYVSSSLGLLDALKRKPIKTYDWPEYHGESLDLSNAKYEAREIVLNCFVTGDNYEEMFINFRNIVMSEFQKSGTQRLLVEAFGLKALPYEVYLIDDVKLLKEFKNSKTVGVFQLKLIEPNPIKKVLYLVGNTLNLSYNSTSETEIFFNDGTKQIAKGNVSLSGKNIPNRVISDYAFSGRNLVKNSNTDIGVLLLYGVTADYIIADDSNITKKIFKATNIVRTIENYVFFIPLGNSPEKFSKNLANVPLTISFYIRTNNSQILNLGNQNFNVDTNFKRIVLQYIWTRGNLHFNLVGADLQWFEIHSLKIEEGNKATDWTPAPEDEKFIIIAGDIDGITNLTTNAVVLWEKL